MQVIFHGTRGSIPTPLHTHLRHGGNTACVEVLAGPHRLILDAGTGIRTLTATPGEHLHLFFSHFHWDHLQGLPYFAPLYHPQARITFYSSLPPLHLKAILAKQMSAPNFPIDYLTLPGDFDYVQLTAAPYAIADAIITTAPLNHPQGATAYRIQSQEKSVVYATDHEPGSPLDEGLIAAARDTDLLILDAHYTPAEYEQFHRWGHGTWLHAAQLAAQAGTRSLALFHHAPTRTDEQLDEIVREAQNLYAPTFAAREGLQIDL